MADALLAVHELDAFYGDFQALFGVSLKVGPGEVVAPASLVAQADLDLGGFSVSAPFTPELKGVSARLEVVRLVLISGDPTGSTDASSA